MKNLWWVVVLALLAFYTGPTHAGQEQWLTYHSLQGPFDYVPQGCGYGQKMVETPPEGVALPKLLSNKPLYAKWSSPLNGKKDVWMAFDGSKKGKYDILYFDTNCDGNLADEKAIKGISEYDEQATFGPIAVVLAGEDGPVTYHIKINLYTYNSQTNMTLWPAGWYEGDISIGDKKLRCRLIDQNGDGDFTTEGAILLGDVEHRHKVGKYLQYDKKLYRLSVSRDGAYIKLDDAQDVAFVDFTVAPAVSSVLLSGENGSFDITPESGKCKAPAGKYRIEEWKIARPDEKGKKWELIGRYAREELMLDSNKPGQAVAIGEPITCKLDVKQENRNYQFSQSFTNASNSSIEVQCNKQRVEAPKLHIKNKDGSYDKTYSFEYG